MDSNLNNILVHPHVLRKGETVKMLEAKHLTSAMAAWEICLCQRPRVQNYFKNSFHCWMTWCMLNEIFASRNYATWKPGDWHRNIRNYTLKKHQHRERGLLPCKALLKGFVSFSPNHTHLHLMGITLVLVWSELQSGQRLPQHQHGLHCP